MMKKYIQDILDDGREDGWVLEPEAKRLFRLAGLEVPHFAWAKTPEECRRFGEEIGYPLAVKVVSPDVVHKSDSGGVVIGVRDSEELLQIYDRFQAVSRFRGMVIEEMVGGVELIVGAKNDHQFGPVILLGIGGTGVEIYKDAVVRMAPLEEKDVAAMLEGLTARKLLDGYRGGEVVDRQALTRLLMSFSKLVMEIAEQVESIDLNPVFCNAERSVVADARIMLRGEG